MVDTVIVGAGSAGCLLGARLAEDGRSVLLLEAGPDRRGNMPEELLNGWTIDRDLFEWGYRSEALDGRSAAPVRRKKLVGGTSWLTRFTPRGSPADYDDWARRGNAGWSFDEILPYLVRIESDMDFGADPWHGATGPIPSVRYFDRPYSEVTEATIAALLASGFDWVDDHNRPGAVGVGRMPMNSRDGIRVSAADGYLPLGATPPNLTIRGDAQVASIVFEGTTAVGVRLLDGTVVAAELVVICAGVYESPALLMRSGIGPAVQLGPLGIRVLVDLSGVGENLADHPSIDLDCGFSGGPSTDPALHAIATFHSSGRSTRLPPDLMFWLSDPEGDPAEVWISIVLLKPESRGNVRLRSASPTDQPLITLPSLTTTFDLERLTEGYGRAVEIASDLALRRLFAPTTPPDIQAHIRAELFSVPHVVGTCAMGPDPADGAVVDRDCRVHGTERLHVVDASVMPDVPSGFTHMPTLMIAERIADVILHGSP